MLTSLLKFVVIYNLDCSYR